MMASRLVAPGDALHEGWAYGAGWQPLLPQERDVLACLANGLGPFAISERLAITEVEVVRRIHSAALKMRARTHDQALALAIARGQVRLLEKALSQLPEKSRIALEMHRFGGCKYAEIAKRLDVSVGTAHGLVTDAIEHCKQILAKGG